MKLTLQLLCCQQIGSFEDTSGMAGSMEENTQRIAVFERDPMEFFSLLYSYI